MILTWLPWLYRWPGYRLYNRSSGNMEEGMLPLPENSMIWSRIKRLVSPRLQTEAISNMEELVDPKRASRFNAFLVPCTYESEMDRLNRDLRAQVISAEDYKREAARIRTYYG